MKKQIAFLRLFSGVLIVLVLLGTGSSATVLQSTDKVVSAAAPASGVSALPTNDVLVIPSAAFRNDGNLPGVGFYSFWGGYWRGDSVNTPCFMAPVYLPRIAKIYQVFATAYDNDDVRDFWVSLYKVDNYSGQVFVLAELTSSGASTALVSLYDTSVLDAVAYPQFSYYLGTCLSSASHRLYSVRVWYSSYETHLPLITR